MKHLTQLLVISCSWSSTDLWLFSFSHKKIIWGQTVTAEEKNRWVKNAYIETLPRTRQHCGPSFIKSQIARLRLQIFPLWMALHSYVYSCVLLCVINGRLFGWLIFISKPRFLQHWWSGRWIWYAMQVHGLRFRLYLYLSANEEDSGWEILGRQ